MNMSRRTIKTLIAVTITFGVLFLVINTISPSYYTGVDLEFPIGAGVVQITNPSDALPAQLISSNSRVFRISSSSEDIAGVSVRQSNGNESTQLLEFELPSGESEFTVTGNTDVRFMANTVITLDATVYPLSSDEINTRIIALVVFVFVMLFYISHLYDHTWMSAARRQNAKDTIATQKAEQDNFDQMMKNRASKRDSK